MQELLIDAPLFPFNGLLDTHCFPCLNGTVRERRSAFKTCTPCTEPYTHAPFLGMSACICIDGYSLVTDACVPTSLDSFYPWWHANSPLIPSVMAALVGTFVIVFAVLLVWCF